MYSARTVIALQCFPLDCCHWERGIYFSYRSTQIHGTRNNQWALIAGVSGVGASQDGGVAGAGDQHGPTHYTVCSGDSLVSKVRLIGPVKRWLTTTRRKALRMPAIGGTNALNTSMA